MPMIHGCIVFHGFLPYWKFLGASRHLQQFYATTCKTLNRFRRFSTIARCHEDLNWYGLEKTAKKLGGKIWNFLPKYIYSCPLYPTNWYYFWWSNLRKFFSPPLIWPWRILYSYHHSLVYIAIWYSEHISTWILLVTFFCKLDIDIFIRGTIQTWRWWWQRLMSIFITFWLIWKSWPVLF